MNRTMAGRLTQLRGARQQIETYIRQTTELGPWAPVAVPILLYIFGKTYQDERKRMQEERVRPIKQEKGTFLNVERQLVREIVADGGRRSVLSRMLPRRVKRR